MDQIAIDVRRLIDDAGGASKLARLTGIHRNTWGNAKQRAKLSSRTLSALLAAAPHIRIEDYVSKADEE